MTSRRIVSIFANLALAIALCADVQQPARVRASQPRPVSSLDDIGKATAFVLAQGSF